MSYVVGIDLGTTHVAVADQQQSGGPLEIVPLRQLVGPSTQEGRPLLPAALVTLPEDEPVADPWGTAPWVAGTWALRRGAELPGHLVTSAKSWLCHSAIDRESPCLPWGAAEGSPKLSPVDATRMLLRQVRASWEHLRGLPLAEQLVILTIPASFDPVARELTLRAARAEGLEVQLLEEPVAAYYAARHDDEVVAPVETLVVDVGGGTSDFTIIQDDGREWRRQAVGRHLLLGGDNIDLALARHARGPLESAAGPLTPEQEGQLLMQCREGKERLLATDAPLSYPLRLLGRGSSLVGGVRSGTLDRDTVRQVVLDGFFPLLTQVDCLPRRRTGLRSAGLPFEQDPRITAHLGEFLRNHDARPTTVVVNGGPFASKLVRDRLLEWLEGWSGTAVRQLHTTDATLAVARGAVRHGLGLRGVGQRVRSSAARTYYVGVGAEEGRRAVCIAERTLSEGEVARMDQLPIALIRGMTARFELYFDDGAAKERIGDLVDLDTRELVRLPAVETKIEGQAGEHLPVALETALTSVGTLELHCVTRSEPPLRYRLAFHLHGESPTAPSPKGTGTALVPRDAEELLRRVFGKGRSDVGPREAKDLFRNLEKVLGPRAQWNLELLRGLFDLLVPMQSARHRSADHERVFWMLAGFSLRPGFGATRDGERCGRLAQTFTQWVRHQDDARIWQQLFIALRRVSGGLDAATQLHLFRSLAPFVAPEGSTGKRPRGVRPQALPELWTALTWLERLPVQQRTELGTWLLDRTWTDRDPILWQQLGRVGARVPFRGTFDTVVGARTAQRWLDHLLRERWEEVPTAASAAAMLARCSGNDALDLPYSLREQLAERLKAVGAPPPWIEGILHHVPERDTDLEDRWGEELPPGLFLTNALH